MSSLKYVPCLFLSCYDTVGLFVDCIVYMLSAFDLRSSDFYLFFLLRTMTRFTKLSGTLEEFTNVYKHG